MPTVPPPPNRRNSPFALCLAAAAVIALARPGLAPAAAAPADADHADHADHLHETRHDSELGHAHTGPHAAHPHLTHPLVTESPLPESQVRFDVSYARTSEDDGDANSLVAEASVEVAITPNVGLELALPYVWTDVGNADGSDGIGNAEVAIKFADYRFGRSGVVLGAGFEVGLPTGDDRIGTGDDRQVELEPYAGLGYRGRNFEAIGLLRFGVPVNERSADADEVDLELAADLSFLYHVTPQLAALLEFNGAAVVAGEADDTLLTVSPGVSIDPFGDGQTRVGFGLGVPVTDDAGFDYEARAMVLLHL